MQKKISLIDTHCHINIMVKENFDSPLDLYQNNTRIQEIIAEARAQQVDIIINVGTSLVESRNCLLLATNFPTVFAVIGIHPTDCTDQWSVDVQALENMLKNDFERRIVGIGECGLDLFHKNVVLQRQIDAFKAQIELALKYDKALVVHSRDAYDETLKILEGYKTEPLRGIIHCFSYDKQFAETVLAWNFSLGIGGTVTYPKNNLLRDVVRAVTIERMVLETDSPYLPPQIIRGKQNQPQYIAHIAQYIAELKGTSFEDVATHTTHTARTLFRIQKKWA